MQLSKTFRRAYSLWFIAPAAIIYALIFIIPTFSSFFFSLTNWTLVDWEFIGLENFRSFLAEPSLRIGIRNTIVYGFCTSFGKVVISLFLAILLTQGLRIEGYLRTVVFFPTLISTVAVGIAFKSILHPTNGILNKFLEVFGIEGPQWLTDRSIALFSVIGVDIWKGLGIATLIYIAGIQSIPGDYYEAARIDGAGSFQSFLYITLPLIRPAMNSVITLSLIGGLRNFDLIWATTGGGPGFTTELLTTVIYRLFSNGLYGLSTAGNVMLFIVVSAIAFPLQMFITKKEAEI